EKVGDDFSAAIVSKEGPTKRAAGLLLGKAEEELNKRDLKLPDIKLGVLPRIPQLKILGGFSLSPLSVPNIEWHKHGGFFDSARIIGIGEAGPEAAVPLVGRRMDPFADAVFNRFANRFRSAFGTNSPNSDKQFDLTIYLSGFIQPIIEALLDTTNKIEKHFETLGSKIIGVTDNLKDVLSQQIDSNINLEAASDAVKNTLQNAQRNLSEQFMYNMDSKIPTLSASRIPNLNNVMTAVQPAASDNREINLTVNLNALMDGKSVAEITAPYTTEIQEREKQQRSRFKG
ncbi:hypothetical protein ACS2Q5_32450, partial [Bacillus cereus group sp. Bce022]|nr:hypothetical protein [Bacillus cereus]